MKFEEPQKITALGVVIFSFISLVLGTVIVLTIDSIAALLVLNTKLPESIFKISSVLAGGIGLITSTAFMTVKTGMKGILAAAIVTAVTIGIKLLGNHLLNLGGYFTINGLVGILFTIIFSLAGGMVGASVKR